jgi:OOP family OmpA-OmpF porin
LSLGIDASGASTDLTSAVSFVSNSGGSPAGTLAPGETATFKADYLIEEGAADAGGVSNFAIATGNTPLNGPITDETDVPAVIVLPPSVDIEVIEEILSDDLLQTVTILSNNASRISRDAADRLRINNGRACGAEINDLLRASPVQFANDSFFLDVENNALLDEIVRVLNTCPTAEFMIAGHTDSDADDAYNLVLSQNRVDAVHEALTRRGVAEDRLQTQGFGESNPIATNATEEGQALNRRVEFILVDDVSIADQMCDTLNTQQRTLNGSANNDGATLTGNYAAQRYNCSTSVYSETWSELNVTHDDDRGTLGLWTLGTLRERQASNLLFGRFIEGYVSKNDVDTADASGTIIGGGVHAGLYSAYGTQGGLILSYYGSAALGQHNFELSAGADVDGNYKYYGIFAGGAIGGKQELGDYEVRPRVGVDLAYGEAIGSEISIPDVELDIDPATYTRGFVEVGISSELKTGTMSFIPRIFCVQNSRDDDACGSGGSLSFKTFADQENTQWDMSIDYEMIDDRQTGSVRGARSLEVFDGLGVSRSSLGASTGGALEVEQTLEFAW